MIEAFIDSVKIHTAVNHMMMTEEYTMETQFCFVDTAKPREYTPMQRLLITYSSASPDVCGPQEVRKYLVRKTTEAIAHKRDRLEHERLSNLHSSEQIREIQAVAAAAGELERYSDTVSRTLRTRYPSITDSIVGRGYPVGFGTGGGALYEGHDDSGGRS